MRVVLALLLQAATVFVRVNVVPRLRRLAE
jgi:hypothetical protein